MFSAWALALLLTPAASDPRATAIADQVMVALGGTEAWNATHYLRFDFAVDVKGRNVMTRSHWWNKWTGAYRVEGKDKDGQAYLVLMNLNTRQGEAWLSGKPTAGEQQQKLLERGYSIWVNDTYWLLMPYKLRDPGVSLAYAGAARMGAARCDKISLTFEGVGLTPKDHYWIYVDRDTHLVDGWDYILQDEKGPATHFDWTGWKACGRVQLAPERMNARDGERIHFPVLEAPDQIPETAFKSSGPVR